MEEEVGMARWRLTARHYINARRFGQPTQWVREETSRETGRVNRVVYDVPMYLDPDNLGDQNYPGEVIISYPRGALGQDIVVPEGFVPTMDMEALDEEATQITKALPARRHPIDDLPPGGDTYADRILEKLSAQLEEAFKRSPQSEAAGPDVVKKMQEDIKMLMEANAKLQAQLAARK